MSVAKLANKKLAILKSGKRYLRDYEARDIEQRLEIPKGWLDRKDSLKTGFKAIQWYRTLDNQGKQNFSSLVSLIDSEKIAYS